MADFIDKLGLQDAVAQIKGYVDDANSEKSVVFNNYSAMVTALNAANSNKYQLGQSIYVITADVPDVWISSVEASSSTYTYVDDATLVNALKTTGYVQIGYYVVRALEGEKPDLSNYVTFEDIFPAFNTSTSYRAGDIVSYNGEFYRFYNSHQGAWDLNDVEQVTMQYLLSEIPQPMTEYQVEDVVNNSLYTTYSINVTVTNGTYIGNTLAPDGASAEIIIVPDEGYMTPNSVTVTNATSNYNVSLGRITLTIPTGTVAITASCPVYEERE